MGGGLGAAAGAGCASTDGAASGEGGRRVAALSSSTVAQPSGKGAGAVLMLLIL